MRKEYSIGLIVLVLVAVGLAVIFASPKNKDITRTTGAYERYKEIVNPSGFVNTDTITIGELVGKKVILVDFLTYSCINCQRTFPYLNAWYAKYKDQGLEIVGIHTPEFAFEKDIKNVEKAMAHFGIKHPVVLDNDYATWNAYGNQYWPRKYLIDIHGNIVYDHIGEGGYEETEKKIQELLIERARVLGEKTIVSQELGSAAIVEAENAARSPETYFGSARNEYLANGPVGRSGERTFTLGDQQSLNKLYLGGTWNITPEYAESVSEAKVVYRYNAREVYLVADAEDAVVIDILQDSKLSGTVTIEDSRLYALISNTEGGEHTLELRVRSGKARLYAFTFG